MLLHLHDGDYTPAEAWRLCAWCHAQGADELTLDVLTTLGPGEPGGEDVLAPLAPFARPAAEREHMTAQTRNEFVRTTELWTLDAGSLAVLPSLFPDGPFTYDAAADTWCENLTLYRDGELLLGIDTVDRWGILRLTELDAARLGAAGFPLRHEHPWG